MTYITKDQGLMMFGTNGRHEYQIVTNCMPWLRVLFNADLFALDGFNYY